jgi:hypothetical protein
MITTSILILLFNYRREDTAKGEEQRKEAEHLRELWQHAEMRVEALEHELELARTHAM